MKRIAIFGGTFDPPHVGHVLAVQYILLTTPVDRVFVVPCGRHPFGKEHVVFPHRLAMCRLAFGSLGRRVRVLDIEGKREGPSYAIDTVREIARKYKGANLAIVVGSDLVSEIDDWKDASEIRRLASVCVLPRVEETTANTDKKQRTSFYLPCVSSTTTRTMLAQRRDVSTRIPLAVVEYIRKHRLYAVKRKPRRQEKKIE